MPFLVDAFSGTSTVRGTESFRSCINFVHGAVNSAGNGKRRGASPAFHKKSSSMLDGYSPSVTTVV